MKPQVFSTIRGLALAFVCLIMSALGMAPLALAGSALPVDPGATTKAPTFYLPWGTAGACPCPAVGGPAMTGRVEVGTALFLSGSSWEWGVTALAVDSTAGATANTKMLTQSANALTQCQPVVTAYGARPATGIYQVKWNAGVITGIIMPDGKRDGRFDAACRQ